jgi:hypothetical protein
MPRKAAPEPVMGRWGREVPVIDPLGIFADLCALSSRELGRLIRRWGRSAASPVERHRMDLARLALRSKESV